MPSTPHTPQNGLWHPYKIPIIVLAGETDSGKTMWGLTVDKRTFDFSQEPCTITWDLEGSSVPYVGALNFKRVDLVESAIKSHGEGYRNLHLYDVWRNSIESIKKDQYTVGMIDTASEIEDGLGQYMKLHPGEFGWTSAQFEKAGGLFWGALKAEWKRLIMYAAAKFQSLVINVHMKAEWKGKTVTGKRIPKGKDVLVEVASLYMTLVRNMKSGVGNQPVKPSGLTKRPHGKSRLMRVDPETGQPQQLLPPVVMDASPDGIRKYLLNPPNFSKLKPSERALPEITLTEDDRLVIQANIASDNAVAAESALEETKLRKKIHDEVDYTKPKSPVDNGRLDKLKTDFLRLYGLGQARVVLLNVYNATKMTDLTPGQVTDLEDHISAQVKN